MSKFKGTRGEAVIYKPDHIGCVNVSLGRHIGFGAYLEFWYHQFENKKSEAEANANLIVDAFKVRQQINCELSELLQQNNQNLILLKDCLTHFQALDNLGLENNVPKWLINQLIKKQKDNE